MSNRSATHATFVIERDYDAPPAQVFAAWASVEAKNQWFGPEGGGENHPDAIMSMQSIEIDGRQIVKEGVIVGPSRLVDLSKKLQPIYV